MNGIVLETGVTVILEQNSDVLVSYLDGVFSTIVPYEDAVLSIQEDKDNKERYFLHLGETSLSLKPKEYRFLNETLHIDQDWQRQS